MAVGAEGEVRAGEGRDEKEESGVGEVEVGKETADPFKFVGRIDECGGGALMRGEGVGGFENAGGGGADGDKFVGSGCFLGESSWDFIMFRVHRVIAKVFCFDGAKGAESDVESDEGVGELGEEFWGKVEASGGGSDGARGLGVGGLVVCGVGGLKIGLALNFSGLENVGREWG
jgi:hypothetical protein